MELCTLKKSHDNALTLYPLASEMKRKNPIIYSCYSDLINRLNVSFAERYELLAFITKMLSECYVNPGIELVHLSKKAILGLTFAIFWILSVIFN